MPAAAPNIEPRRDWKSARVCFCSSGGVSYIVCDVRDGSGSDLLLLMLMVMVGEGGKCLVAWLSV